MDNLIKIKDMSSNYDITARTLRYYESMGLITSTRSDNYAYRMYDEEAVRRLEQILILRKLNISIKDIQRIFNTSGSDVVLEVLGNKVEKIDDEVALLYELKDIVLDFIHEIKQVDFADNSDIKLLYNKAKDIETQLIGNDYIGKPSNINRLAKITEKLDKKIPDIMVVRIPEFRAVTCKDQPWMELFKEGKGSNKLGKRVTYFDLMGLKRIIIILILVVASVFHISCDRKDNLYESTPSSDSSTKKIDVQVNDVKEVDSEYDTEIKELIRKANNNDFEAMNTLAYYYFNGYGVEQDYDKSLDWSIMSAEGGNLASMFNVGYHYYYGFTGEVNYKLAFEWYKKAADKAYPKALNALGHMYYKGLGVEKDLDKAVEYTYQSAGYLHNYSLSNMGAIIEEEKLGDNADFWYRLAAKNYMIQSGSTNILYDKLVNGDIDINVEYSINSDSIPEELIKDILYKFYSGTLYKYIETSNQEFKDFKLGDYIIDEEVKPFINPHWWYDGAYLVDINNDDVKEIISYIMDGTGGGVSFRVLHNIDDEYKLIENNTYPMSAGINGLITFDDKKYFVVANVDIGNRIIYEVDIYSFDEYKLDDLVRIKIKEYGVQIMNTYQLSDDYDELVQIIEKRLSKAFEEKYNILLYKNVNETLTLDTDINNDGDIEHYEYESIFYGTINRPLSIDFMDNLTSEDDLLVIEEILKFNDLAIPIGIEMFTLEGVNYIGLLSYELGTNNHCLTTFKLKDGDMALIANHLIAFKEKFIVK